MKKGIIAVLVILALVVLISPGIVGRMAERSVDEQLQWGASENQEVVVTTEAFDRGWFSSEGTHRIEISNTGPGQTVREALSLGPDDPGPALLIDTRLDHGLIPVASIAREEGSLAPGLGRAVSTMRLETMDGETIEVPGVIYSSVGLDGGLTSHYFLESGSSEDTRWGAADLKIEADANAGDIAFDGGLDSIRYSLDDQTISFGLIEMDGDMNMTDFGYAVGDVAFSMASIDIDTSGTNVNMGPINVSGSSALDGDRVDSDFNMDFAMNGIPNVGDVSWTMDASMNDVDAASFGRLLDAVDSMGPAADPTMMLASLENDAMDLVAAGFVLTFDQLDVTVPQGTVYTKFAFEFPETDRSSFAWTSVLMALKASADIRIPVELFELAAMMNPQANAAVAMGFLQLNGDMYEMEARYEKGLLTVNGAPMPIPMPGM